MDNIFAPGNMIRIEYLNGNSTRVAADYFYQAFKQRLIEEVVTIGPDLAIIRLIDTTSGGVKKYAGEALDRLIDTTERENG